MTRGVRWRHRAAFAKANGEKAALFSANSEGACQNCKGIGLVYTDLAMMAGVASVCEQCEGKRFTPKVLTHQLRGKNIAEATGRRLRDGRGWIPRVLGVARTTSTDATPRQMSATPAG